MIAAAMHTLELPDNYILPARVLADIQNVTTRNAGPDPLPVFDFIMNDIKTGLYTGAQDTFKIPPFCLGYPLYHAGFAMTYLKESFEAAGYSVDVAADHGPFGPEWDLWPSGCPKAFMPCPYDEDAYRTAMSESRYTLKISVR